MRVLITAGPTREYLDAVRFLSNPSSGTMGICLAEKAHQRGWETTLILGPTHLSPSLEIPTIRVVSTEDMYTALWKEMDIQPPQAVIMTAAPCDFRPKKREPGKIKKGEVSSLTLELVPTPDILAGLGKSLGKFASPPLLFGFAMEKDQLLERAQQKLRKKNLQMILGNTPGSFASSVICNSLFLHRNGRMEEWGDMKKDKIAQKILEEIEKDLSLRKF